MIMKRKNEITRDLTEGSPIKLLIAFIIPTLFGYLFQHFYNIADSVVVGRVLGAEALAGVGSTSSVTFLVLQPLPPGCFAIYSCSQCISRFTISLNENIRVNLKGSLKLSFFS